MVLGNEISKVDQAKIEVKAKLLVGKYIKNIWSFLGHAVCIIGLLWTLVKLLDP